MIYISFPYGEREIFIERLAYFGITYESKEYDWDYNLKVIAMDSKNFNFLRLVKKGFYFYKVEIRVNEDNKIDKLYEFIPNEAIAQDLKSIFGRKLL